jgi:PAS domain S-box-containing protein
MQPDERGLDVERIGAFLRENHGAILENWLRACLSLPSAKPLSASERADNLPQVLNQIADLADSRTSATSTAIATNPAREHAFTRLAQGYDLGEVVDEYRFLVDAVLEIWAKVLGVQEISLQNLASLHLGVQEATKVSLETFAKARERTLKALDRIVLSVLDIRSQEPSLDATLSALARTMLESTSAIDSVVILLREGDQLRVRAAAGMEEAIGAGFPIHAQDNFAGRIAATREPLLIHDAAHDPLVASPSLRARSTRALYGVPLISASKVIGVAHMGSRLHRDLPDGDKILFRAMATRATTLLTQAQLYERLARSETDAARQAAMFDALVSSVPNFLYLIDQQHCFIYANRPLLTLWGKSLAEARGLTFEDLGYPPDLVALHRTQLSKAFAGDTVRGENAYTGPTGTRFYEYDFIPIRSGDGRVESVAGVTRDVTERRQREEELRAQAAFEKYLIGIVSHDLRSPVTSIKLSAQTLLRQNQLPERQSKSVVRIVSAAERASRMVADLLDFTKARHGGIPVRPSAVNLRELIPRTVDEVQAEFPGRQIVTDLQGDTQGQWDADRLAQVVTNLLRNALTYSLAGTPIRVFVEAGEDAVTLGVQNEGPPIPAAKQPLLFEPMQRGSDDGGEQRNIGLGLFIVSAIVKAHRGTIDVTSTQEAGTTFLVRLPRRAAEPT